MFSHIMVGANDIQKSQNFYDAILGTLGYPPGVIDDKGRCFYFSDRGVFGISIPIDSEPACHGNGSTIGFAAKTPADAEAWHAAGLAHGGTTCEEPPGLRESPMGKMYLAYLRDPAGNKLCALHRMA